MTDIIFPDNPKYYDNFHVIDILDYYDGPKAFTFHTTSGDFFLAYFADDDGNSEEWIYTPTSESTVSRLIKNELSIRDFFKLSHVCYFAKTKNKSVITVERKFFEDLESRYIPDEDVFLDFSETLINIKLVKKNISPSNTSEIVIGNVTSHVRKLFKDTMRILRDQSTDFRDCSTSPEFAYSGIIAGSVSIILKPIHRNLLLEKALQIIEKVATDNSSDIEDEIVEKVERSLIPLAPNSKSKVYGFDSIDVSGIVPTSLQPQQISFSLNSAMREKLQKKYGKESQSLFITFTGLAEAGDNVSQSFELRELEANQLDYSSVKCTFDPEEIELYGDLEEAAVWEFMRISSQKRKLRVSGEYDSKEALLNVRSIQAM
jgi:hypothetical protein